MDIDLLSKMIKELILDTDEVTLPGVGTFVAEIVPSTFSDKGYTINPPYRRLSFRQRQTEGSTMISDFYAASNNLDRQSAEMIIGDFMKELKDVLQKRKMVVFPGLGRLRATRENTFFFVADEDLDIYPAGFGLESVSLKSHEDSPETVSAALASLKTIITEPEAEAPAVEAEVTMVPEPEVVPIVLEPEPEVEPAPEVQAVEPEVTMVPEPEAVPVVLEPEVKPEVVPESEPEATPEATITPATYRKEHQATSRVVIEEEKGTSWISILAWIAVSAVLLFIIFIAVARMVPGIFDFLLYSKDELEILRF